MTPTRLLAALAAAAIAALAPKYDTIPRPVVPVPTIPPTQETGPCGSSPATR